MIRSVLCTVIATMCGEVSSGVSFDVRAFGAKGDGVSKDTAAIQSAIDAAGRMGGGRVTLAAGTYLSGSVYLKDGVELHLEADAVLKGSPDPADYNSADVCSQNVASPVSADNIAGGHLVLCIERKNVSITGTGMIDGNVTAFFTGDYIDGFWPNHKRLIKWRPGQMVYFAECENVVLRDVRLRNSPYWSCFLHGCVNVDICGVDVRTLRSPRTWNGDGLDIDCCEHVCIKNCRIRTDDDSITLRCDPTRLKMPRPCRNVRISDCELSSLCNCLRVGVGTGRVENVVAERIRVTDSRIAINVTGTYRPNAKVGGRFRDLVFRDWSGDCWKNFIKVYPGPNNTPELDFTLDGLVFEDIVGRGYDPSEVIGSSVTAPGVMTLRNVVLRDMRDDAVQELVVSNIWNRARVLR